MALVIDLSELGVTETQSFNDSQRDKWVAALDLLRFRGKNETDLQMLFRDLQGFVNSRGVNYDLKKATDEVDQTEVIWP